MYYLKSALYSSTAEKNPAYYTCTRFMCVQASGLCNILLFISCSPPSCHSGEPHGIHLYIVMWVSVKSCSLPTLSLHYISLTPFAICSSTYSSLTPPPHSLPLPPCPRLWRSALISDDSGLVTSRGRRRAPGQRGSPERQGGQRSGGGLTE